MWRELGCFELTDVAEVDGSFVGFVDACVGVAEGVLLGDEVLFDGTVVDGS